LDDLVTAAFEADADTRDDAMNAAMSAVIALGPGYWDTSVGQRLRPLWEDWSDAIEADARSKEAELERRVMANDWDGWPTPRPFRMPNGLMSDDAWALGDPFAN
jgi:hypothetical protein